VQPARDGTSRTGSGAPTIYDVARAAGVSIASVSRVLNEARNTRPETRDKVIHAVAELGFAPDGAARALSGRLKEVVGVIERRPFPVGPGIDEDDAFADEAESLQFHDMINRGIEMAAQGRGFDILIRSVDVNDHDAGYRTLALARKSDGLILHDRLVDPEPLRKLAAQVPIVTLAGVATPETVNVSGDNASGMRALARHLLDDHGYRSIGYVGGYADSPDSLARHQTLAAEAAASGADFCSGPNWKGNYYAAGGALVVDRLMASGITMPRAIACANDQTALGVMNGLRRHGIDVPSRVAVTGFDDIAMARHLRCQLTTVRQPIRDLGATAFEVLYSMINGDEPAERDIVLPTRLVVRESCGCGMGA
jgi:LacI family transcriptional regulator